MKRVRFIGLDVHADTIAVAVAEPGGRLSKIVAEGDVVNGTTVRSLSFGPGGFDGLQVAFARRSPTGARGSGVQARVCRPRSQGSTRRLAGPSRPAARPRARSARSRWTARSS